MIPVKGSFSAQRGCDPHVENHRPRPKPGPVLPQNWLVSCSTALTCAVVDNKEVTVGAQELIRDYGIHIFVSIQGQDRPIEHGEGCP